METLAIFLKIFCPPQLLARLGAKILLRTQLNKICNLNLICSY